MALFLRGDVWWFEYRTRKVRHVRSTGFRRGEKAKARAVYDAFRVAMGAGVKPKHDAMASILQAIYGDGNGAGDLALSSVWNVYQDWLTGKAKVLSKKEAGVREGVVRRFCAWAAARRAGSLGDVDVALAREFVKSVRDAGRSNKTQRSVASILSSVWEAVGQLRAGVHNPWKAAMPDKDGSEVTRPAFTPEQESAVLDAAKRLGHDWWLASMIARWTGLRYGDVATLEWADVDLGRRVIETVPNKTRKHKVAVMVPIADALYDALAGVAQDRREGSEEAGVAQDRRDGSEGAGVGQDRREGFVLPEHGTLYPSPLTVPFSDVLRAAGIEGAYTFHSWRHTFRTRLAEAGVSDEVARRLGGWTNLKMAAHYDHASHLAEMREAIGKMTTFG